MFTCTAMPVFHPCFGGKPDRLGDERWWEVRGTNSYIACVSLIGTTHAKPSDATCCYSTCHCTARTGLGAYEQNVPVLIVWVR